MNSVKSTDIKQALSNYHKNDFFACEVKNGPTYNPVAGGLLIFDALSVSKSWSSPCITIYEIKVSRSDFLRDGKWQCYLPYCHEFYFVCPKGMIKKEELPLEAGLKYYNPESGEVRTVKKSLYRKIDIHPEMLLYILMNKADSDRYPFHNSKFDYAKAYLENKEAHYHIGCSLGTAMAKEIDELKEKVLKGESDRQRRELLDQLLLVFRKHGISIWDEKHLVDNVDKALSAGYPKEIEYILNDLQRVTKRMETMDKKYKPKDPVSEDPEEEF